MRGISMKGWTGALARLAVCAALGVAGLQAAPALFADRDAPSPAPPATSDASASIAASPASAPSPQPASLPAEAAERRGVFPDIQVHTELPITVWLRPGEYAWDDDGVPAGPVTIVVNIRARVLSAYRAGFEIGRSSIVYGIDSKPTPFGTFPILEKDADHYSSTYGGAPMPHMLRLTRDGVSIHGSEIADDLATHGCIGLPKEFAALLFGAAHVGDKVVVWPGDRVPGAEAAPRTVARTV
jgi:hypothetical protein